MIILKKKRIIVLLNLIILTVVVCGMQSVNLNNTRNISKNTTQVVALPVTNKTVVIDARTRSTRWRGILTALNKKY